MGLRHQAVNAEVAVELLTEKGLACVFLENTLRSLYSKMNIVGRKARMKGAKRKEGLHRAEMCSKDFSPSSWFVLHTRSASKEATAL